MNEKQQHAPLLATGSSTESWETSQSTVYEVYIIKYRTKRSKVTVSIHVFKKKTQHWMEKQRMRISKKNTCVLN